LAAAVALPVIGSQPLFAQTPPAPAASKADTPTTQLLGEVDDFWHYAKIARYDLALAAGKKVVADKSTPRQVLAAFQQVAEQHHDDMNDWLLRWQGIDALRDVSTQILNIIKKGQFQLRADQAFIEQNIQRLSVNDRAFSLAMINLRQSGELAYPLMIEYLRDPAKQQYQYSVMRAMRELGRVGLNPLVAATYSTDPAVLVPVAQVLGELGYDGAVPYLARLAQDKKTPAAARQSAQNALRGMGAGDPAKLNVAQLYFGLGEAFYYGKASISYDNRNPAAYIWSWEKSKGLVKKDVPPAIYSDVMAMNVSADALRADSTFAKAVSLWLASDYKREADLPAGAVDPTRPANDPGAHFYGVSLGTRYLNDVLDRALGDRNSAVALRAIKSLEQIVGQSNLFSGGQPIIAALDYPDRQVRFEAAFTLAAALPQKAFDGDSRVVPTLAEALSQNSKVNLLVVAPKDKLAGLIAGLKKAGYNATGAANAGDAVAESATLPAIDVVLFSDDLKPQQINDLLSMVKQNPHLRGAGLIAMDESGSALSYSKQALVAATTRPADLKTKIDEARQKTGGLPLDAKTAVAYALRSADLLHAIALNRNPVYDLAPAQTQLLASLNDSRAQVIQASGRVLAHIDAKPVQESLLHKATDAKTEASLKVSLLDNLATNAKFFGSHLDAAQVKDLQAIVAGEKDSHVRNAAAEAQGALNLPADQAKALILKQGE
jgi:hypothetical protein